MTGAATHRPLLHPMTPILMLACRRKNVRLGRHDRRLLASLRRLRFAIPPDRVQRCREGVAHVVAIDGKEITTKDRHAAAPRVCTCRRLLFRIASEGTQVFAEFDRNVELVL
jgi:hypothetical protein